MEQDRMAAAHARDRSDAGPSAPGESGPSRPPGLGAGAEAAVLAPRAPWDILRAAFSSPRRRSILIRSLRFAPAPPPQLRGSLSAGGVRSWVGRWLTEADVAPGPDHLNLALHLRMAGLSREELLDVLGVLLLQEPGCLAVLSEIFDAEAAKRLTSWAAKVLKTCGAHARLEGHNPDTARA